MEDKIFIKDKKHRLLSSGEEVREERLSCITTASYH
jgi:hypothetical protein